MAEGGAPVGIADAPALDDHQASRVPVVTLALCPGGARPVSVVARTIGARPLQAPRAADRRHSLASVASVGRTLAEIVRRARGAAVGELMTSSAAAGARAYGGRIHGEAVLPEVRLQLGQAEQLLGFEAAGPGAVAARGVQQGHRQHGVAATVAR